jgi:hypothetical protein
MLAMWKSTARMLVLSQFEDMCHVIIQAYDPTNRSGRAVESVRLQPFACKGCGFESARGHGYLSLVSVVFCEVEVSAMGRTLIQRRAS